MPLSPAARSPGTTSTPQQAASGEGLLQAQLLPLTLWVSFPLHQLPHGEGAFLFFLCHLLLIFFRTHFNTWELLLSSICRNLTADLSQERSSIPRHVHSKVWGKRSLSTQRALAAEPRPSGSGLHGCALSAPTNSKRF